MSEHHHYHHHEEMSRENAVTLLEYMLDHNRHHTEELEEAMSFVNEEATSFIHEAVHAYEKGNALLAEALKKMRNE